MSESHYFTTPSGPEKRREVTAFVAGREYRFVTANGVFSQGGLDRATAVLLREAPLPGPADSLPDTDSPRLLDLGCGWGAIAVVLADRCPGAVVDAVDVNERALALCADNAATAGVGARVRPLLPESVDPTVRYDQIWSNPPIRIGKPALHELLLTWLPRLSATGVAHLVVGKDLGADSLQRWIGEQGFDCVRIVSDKGFRVFAVRHSNPAVS